VHLELAIINLDDHLHLIPSSHVLYEILHFMQVHEIHPTHIHITKSEFMGYLTMHNWNMFTIPRDHLTPTWYIVVRECSSYRVEVYIFYLSNLYLCISPWWYLEGNN
jgi:hypothetical protein